MIAGYGWLTIFIIDHLGFLSLCAQQQQLRYVTDWESQALSLKLVFIVEQEIVICTDRIGTGDGIVRVVKSSRYDVAQDTYDGKDS